MSTTASVVVSRAMGLSLRNRQDAVATYTTELVSVIQRGLVEMFDAASTIYPEYFGVREVVTYNTGIGGWARPSRALALYRIESPTGAEVVVVHDQDRVAERFKGSVVERGRVFYPNPDSTVGPVTGDLPMYYARSAAQLADGTLDQTIDSALPDDYVWYLVYIVGIYLAQKDQRSDEVPLLQSQADAWFSKWQRYLQEATQNTRHRFQPRGGDAPGTLMTTKAG